VKTRITKVQVSILETKRQRTMELMAQIDAVHRQAAELLELDRDSDGEADCILADYLGGCAFAPIDELLEPLGLGVDP
jgi:hypothetical protein